MPELAPAMAGIIASPTVLSEEGRAAGGTMTRALMFSARWLVATALLRIAGCITRLARKVAPKAAS
jgi:hypothetical protein